MQEKTMHNKNFILTGKILFRYHHRMNGFQQSVPGIAYSLFCKKLLLAFPLIVSTVCTTLTCCQISLAKNLDAHPLWIDHPKSSDSIYSYAVGYGSDTRSEVTAYEAAFKDAISQLVAREGTGEISADQVHGAELVPGCRYTIHGSDDVSVWVQVSCPIANLRMARGRGHSSGRLSSRQGFQSSRNIGRSQANSETDSIPVQDPPQGCGNVIETGAVSLRAESGGVLKLGNGAELQFPKSALSRDADIELVRSRCPEPFRAYAASDTYFLFTTNQVSVSGSYELHIPIAPRTRGKELFGFAHVNGKVGHPVPCTIDEQTGFATFKSPIIAYRDIPVDLVFAQGRKSQSSSQNRWRLGLGVYSEGGSGEFSKLTYSGYWHFEPEHQVFVYMLTDNLLGTMGGNRSEALFKRLAPIVSSAYHDGVQTYRRLYGGTEETTPLPGLREVSNEWPMYIELTDFGNPDPTGEYRPVGLSWGNNLNTLTGVIRLNTHGLTGEHEARERANVRHCTYHELFHAVQDAFCGALLEYFRGNTWWMEATAEWNAQEYGSRRSFIGMVADLLPTHKAVLSIPIRQSVKYSEETADACYAYAILIDFIERHRPGYIRDALHNWSTLSTDRSGELYRELISAGNLYETYPAFLTNIFCNEELVLPWCSVSMIERPGSTRWVINSTPGTENNSDMHVATNRAERMREHTFRMDLEPMTTRFFNLHGQNLGPSHKRHVAFSLRQDGKPTANGLVFLRGHDAGVEVIELSDEHDTVIRDFGPRVRSMLLAAYNTEPYDTKSVALTVQLMGSTTNLLRVTVWDSESSPIRGASVTTESGTNRITRIATDGHADFWLEPASYIVSASKKGYKTARTRKDVANKNMNACFLQLEHEAVAKTNTFLWHIKNHTKGFEKLELRVDRVLTCTIPGSSTGGKTINLSEGYHGIHWIAFSTNEHHEVEATGTLRFAVTNSGTMRVRRRTRSKLVCEIEQ